MLAGEMGVEVPGYDYPNGAHSDTEEGCAGCHMAHTPDYLHQAFADSGAPGAQQVVGGHTFRVTGVIDSALAEATGLEPGPVLNDEGCIECHGEVSLEFVELAQMKIHAMMDEIVADSLVPLRGADERRRPGLPVYDPDGLTAAEQMVVKNYYYVLYDGSYGVHNMPYAMALLKSALAELEASQAAGEIDEIVDVPNDQGGMVRVIWNGFAAEQAGMATITEYGVWRHDPVNDAWVFVGSAPATRQMRYGLDVATDFDSTEMAGAVWSHFKVTATTSDPTVVLSTEPDSGYSIDNLAPMAPPAARVAKQTVSWDRSPSKDVQYYAILRDVGRNDYRPHLTTVDTSVTVEAPFRYAIVAVDYAGNKSEMVVVQVLSVTDVPTPMATALIGNAPNPFNPETVIRYSIHEEATVSITVYDINGRQVRTLVAGSVGVGMHSVTWNGLDNTGHEVASGLYVYSLTTNTGTRDIRRMLLVR
jgi:hypothetical protein